MTHTNPGQLPTPLRWLLTLGPTHEPIDQVRFIGNRSSGRMGFEIAKAARDAGAEVKILAGPCSAAGLDSWPNLARFQTAEELRGLLTEQWKDFDVLVMAAAVADWRVAGAARTGKLRRSAAPPALQLEQVPEILGNLSSRADQFIVGFALEPLAEVVDNALKKLAAKKADCIVANSLETLDSGASDAQLVWPDGRVTTRGGSQTFEPKERIARWIVESIAPAIARKCRKQ
ncbi:MAG: phosphopantothenoylcysteine decarboxylase [Planctomycetes bacterium]|nr:phosphopantothenoylcysteine decarboxylase [Planctomycetota bacterium]